MSALAQKKQLLLKRSISIKTACIYYSRNMKNQKLIAMKKIQKHLLLITLLFVCSTLSLDAQPPDPPEDPQSGGEVVGGGAPIGSGVAILMALGAAYGGKKVWDYRSKLEE